MSTASSFSPARMMSSVPTVSTLSFEIAELPQIFDDVEPIPPADGPVHVCRIDYPPAFAMAYDYFRGVLKTGEVDTPRALSLTQLCLAQNPANYTVWQYRRQCWKAQQQQQQPTEAPSEEDGPSPSTSPVPWSLKDELAWTAFLGGDNPKNYQIWYHRRAMLKILLDQSPTVDPANSPLPSEASVPTIDWVKEELDYVASVLNVDGKNYHAWTHRQWLLQTLPPEHSLWHDELKFVESLLTQDIRNNSAWNQRWFCVNHQPQGNDDSTDAALVTSTKAEMDYALNKASLDPWNESPFTYFLAAAKNLRRQCCRDNSDGINSLWEGEILSQYATKLQSLWPYETEDGCTDIDDSKQASFSVSPFVLSTHVEWAIFQGNTARARSLLLKLADEVDPIRRKYWKLRLDQLSSSVPESPAV